MMRLIKTYILISSLILMAFLFISCSDTPDEPEAKRWNFYEYFNYIKGDSFQYKYKNISFNNFSREKDKVNYYFLYNDSVLLNVDLKDDYSYKIFGYSINSSFDSNFIPVRKPIEEIPPIVKKKLEEVVRDCKRLRLIGFDGFEDRFSFDFLMKNIDLNSIPDTLKSYKWIADTAKAEFTHTIYKGRESTENEVTINLERNWFFTVFKPRNIHF